MKFVASCEKFPGGSPILERSYMSVCAKQSPYQVDVVAGKPYFWCSCGISKKQPFCDGSHKGSNFKPVQYISDEHKTISFCGCKQSKNGGICDGSHKKLSAGSEGRLFPAGLMDSAV